MLLGAVAKKRAVQLGERINAQTMAFDAKLESRLEKTVEEWRAAGNVRRLHRGDKSLWTNSDENKWLGWLDSIEQEANRVGEYKAFGQEIKSEGFTDAVLLGMGGSSLGPEVLAQTLGPNSAWPRLHILDSTDPAQILGVEAAVDLKRTLLIVSSKSGSTTEPNILKDYFYQRLVHAVGRESAGRISSRSRIQVLRWKQRRGPITSGGLSLAIQVSAAVIQCFRLLGLCRRQ